MGYTGPWQLLMLNDFRQQQAWCPLHLTTTSGEVPLEGLTILDFTDQDTMIRSDTELFVMTPATHRLAQCEELHDRPMGGPIVLVDW